MYGLSDSATVYGGSATESASMYTGPLSFGGRQLLLNLVITAIGHHVKEQNETA